MRDDRTWTSAAHPYAWVVAQHFLEKYANHCSLFGSSHRLLLSDLLWQIWTLCFRILGLRYSDYFRPALLFLLEFLILLVCQIFLWDRDRHLSSPFSFLYYLDIPRLHASNASSKIKSLLVGGMSIYLLRWLASSKKQPLENTALRHLPSWDVLAAIIQIIREGKSTIPVGAKKERGGVWASLLHVPAEWALAC